MRTLALIPARGGSKGIPGKNLRVFNGRPLLAWAVAVGRVAADDTIVSTDDAEIADMAIRCGAGVLERPSFLSTDETAMYDVVLHAVTQIPTGDAIVLLQPTQPLRTSEHVKKALRILSESGADSVVSVVEIPSHYSPDHALAIGPNGLKPLPAYVPSLDAAKRRQDCLPAYARDGTVYAMKRQTVLDGSLYGQRCLPMVVPFRESVNLNTQDDWRQAERMVVDR